MRVYDLLIEIILTKSGLGRIKTNYLKAALSIISLRLVAPITKTSSPLSSNCVKICVATPSNPRPPKCECVLAGNNASNSSKNNTQGFDFFARSKTPLINFSLSPIYGLSNSGPLMLMKLVLHSVAIAFANNVLPTPIN